MTSTGFSQFNDVAFSIGSYDRTTEEVRQVGAENLWIVTDMDEGTSFVIVDSSHGLSVRKMKGIIWINSVNMTNKTMLSMIGNLPLKILDGQTVQFTCPRGKFIYLYDRRP